MAGVGHATVLHSEIATGILGADTAGRAAVDGGVTGVPETFIIDEHGVVMAKLIGGGAADLGSVG